MFVVAHWVSANVPSFSASEWSSYGSPRDYSSTGTSIYTARKLPDAKVLRTFSPLPLCPVIKDTLKNIQPASYVNIVAPILSCFETKKADQLFLRHTRNTNFVWPPSYSILPALREIMSHPMQLQLQLQLIASCFFVPCSFLQVSMQVSIMYKSTTISSFSTANHLETSYGLWRLFDLYLFIFVIVQGFCKNSFVMCFMKW